MYLMKLTQFSYPASLDYLVDRLLANVPGVKLLQIMLGGKATHEAAPLEAVAAQRGRARQHVEEDVVRLGEHEPDGAVVHLLHPARLVIDRHNGRLHGHQLVVVVDVFVPEHEVVRREGMAVRPLHAAAQKNGEDAPALRDLPAFGHIGHEHISRIVPEQELVVPAAAVAVPEVGGSAETAPPDAAVLADLVHRFDHQGIRADAFRYRRQFAALRPLRQRRCLAKLLWKLLPVRDDPRPFQLAHQRGPSLC